MSPSLSQCLLVSASVSQCLPVSPNPSQSLPVPLFPVSGCFPCFDSEPRGLKAVCFLLFCFCSRLGNCHWSASPWGGWVCLCPWGECVNSRSSSLTANPTRPVGHPLPAAGEALPWAPAVQPRRPAGELGYCRTFAALLWEKFSLCLCTFGLCSQRASGGRRAVRAVLLPSPTAPIRKTWRRWDTSAGLTSGSYRAEAKAS